MNCTFERYSAVSAPESFRLCIANAARNASAHRPSGRMLPVRAAALIVLLALLSGAAIAVGTLAVRNLFTAENGFMLPDHAWGSTPPPNAEDTISFCGYTGQIDYQYENDRLICVDIRFDRQNQPSEEIRSELSDQLSAEMTALYGPPTEDNSEITSERDKLRSALREHLGISDVPESELLRASLAAAGADPSLQERAVASVELSSDETLRIRTWKDPDTHTAIALYVTTDHTGQIRLIRISLAKLEQ